MFGPIQVRNPNIVNDITAFFGLDLGFEKVENIVLSLSDGSRNKLYKVTERFEFIEQLLVFRKELIKNKKYKKKYFQQSGALNGVSIIENIKMFNEKFDGVDYDIESLVLYLLLTCVDTLAGQDEYKSFSEWLKTNQEEFETDTINLAWIKAKEKEYKVLYGIGRNFKALIIDSISRNLKKSFIENFAVAKLDNGCVNKDSWKEWESANDELRLKKIVNILFEQIRNKYTHTSHRTFIPSVPIRNLRKTEYPVLISLSDDRKFSGNLIFLLKNVVRDIVKYKILLNN